MKGVKGSVFLVVAIVLIVNLFNGSGSGMSGRSGSTELDGLNRAFLGAAGIVVCGSMIFLSRLWSEYILPHGFWESYASDAGRPGRSAPAVALIGWILLALMGVGILMN